MHYITAQSGMKKVNEKVTTTVGGSVLSRTHVRRLAEAAFHDLTFYTLIRKLTGPC